MSLMKGDYVHLSAELTVWGAVTIQVTGRGPENTLGGRKKKIDQKNQCKKCTTPSPKVYEKKDLTRSRVKHQFKKSQRVKDTHHAQHGRPKAPKHTFRPPYPTFKELQVDKAILLLLLLLLLHTVFREHNISIFCLLPSQL